MTSEAKRPDAEPTVKLTLDDVARARGGVVVKTGVRAGEDFTRHKKGSP